MPRGSRDGGQSAPRWRGSGIEAASVTAAEGPPFAPEGGDLPRRRPRWLGDGGGDWLPLDARSWVRGGGGGGGDGRTAAGGGGRKTAAGRAAGVSIPIPLRRPVLPLRARARGRGGRARRRSTSARRQLPAARPAPSPPPQAPGAWALLGLSSARPRTRAPPCPPARQGKGVALIALGEDGR